MQYKIEFIQPANRGGAFASNISFSLSFWPPQISQSTPHRILIWVLNRSEDAQGNPGSLGKYITIYLTACSMRRPVTGLLGDCRKIKNSKPFEPWIRTGLPDTPCMFPLLARQGYLQLCPNAYERKYPEDRAQLVHGSSVPISADSIGCLLSLEAPAGKTPKTQAPL
jgi:hypothetical protein